MMVVEAAVEHAKPASVFLAYGASACFAVSTIVWRLAPTAATRLYITSAQAVAADFHCISAIALAKPEGGAVSAARQLQDG